MDNSLAPVGSLSGFNFWPYYLNLWLVFRNNDLLLKKEHKQSCKQSKISWH